MTSGARTRRALVRTHAHHDRIDAGAPPFQEWIDRGF